MPRDMPLAHSTPLDAASAVATLPVSTAAIPLPLLFTTTSTTAMASMFASAVAKNQGAGGLNTSTLM